VLYFVSRQIYSYPSGKHIVEIAVGGKDYCNPDMLVPNFKDLGEQREFDSATKALEAAQRVATAWRKICNKDIQVAAGCTGGCTLPFEPESNEELKEWAARRDKVDAQERALDFVDDEQGYANA
jgi:hypothetical protein